MMKFFVAILLHLVVGFESFCQDKIEKFFNYKWEECNQANASYYSILEREDSIWHQKDFFIYEKSQQMDGFYKDINGTVKHGAFKYFYANQKLSSQTIYKDGKRNGLSLSYHENGMMRDSTYYRENAIIGRSIHWHPNGKLAGVFQLDTIGYEAGVFVGYFDDGQISQKGRLSKGRKKHGIWNYYHYNGKKSADVIYNNDEVVSQKCFDEQGNNDNVCNTRKQPEFSGGFNALYRYLNANINWPSNVNFTKSGKAVVVLGFNVGINGELKNVRIINGFYKEFEAIAIKAVSGMPTWLPALEFNRRIESKFILPINFVQP